MKKLIDAARGLLSGETGIIRQGKALVVTCAVGAMIAGAAIVGTVGTPSPGGGTQLRLPGRELGLQLDLHPDRTLGRPLLQRGWIDQMQVRLMISLRRGLSHQ